MTRRAGQSRWAALAAVAAITVFVAGCTTRQVPPIPAAELATAKAFKEYTVYWAGPAVGGAPVTEAESPLLFYSPVGFTLYYGNCGSRGALHDGGCTLPLKITTTIYAQHSDASFGPQRWVHLHGVPAVIYHGGDDIEVYTDRMEVDIAADSPNRALEAAQALRPFNRGVSAAFPAFPQPYYTPNVSPQELAAAAAGPTAATGATSSIAPPATLEPTPIPSGS